MNFQCEHYNSKGIRCPNEAVYRAQYAKEHPFDHMDTCSSHLEVTPKYLRLERLDQNANSPQR